MGIALELRSLRRSSHLQQGHFDNPPLRERSDGVSGRSQPLPDAHLRARIRNRQLSCAEPDLIHRLALQVALHLSDQLRPPTADHQRSRL